MQLKDAPAGPDGGARKSGDIDTCSASEMSLLIWCDGYATAELHPTGSYLLHSTVLGLRTRGVNDLFGNHGWAGLTLYGNGKPLLTVLCRSAKTV